MHFKHFILKYKKRLAAVVNKSKADALKHVICGIMQNRMCISIKSERSRPECFFGFTNPEEKVFEVALQNLSIIS